MQPIKHNSIRINACPTHKHDAMRATKHRILKITQSTIKQRENKHNIKQKKQYFLIKDVFSPLVYAFPQWLSPPMNEHEVEFLPLRMCT